MMVSSFHVTPVSPVFLQRLFLISINKNFLIIVLFYKINIKSIQNQFFFGLALAYPELLNLMWFFLFEMIDILTPAL